jgi:hypothetical protein
MHPWYQRAVQLHGLCRIMPAFILQSPDNCRRLRAAKDLLDTVSGLGSVHLDRVGDRLTRTVARQMIAEALALINQCGSKFAYPGKITCGTVKEARVIAKAIVEHISAVALRHPATGVVQSHEVRGRADTKTPVEAPTTRGKQFLIGLILGVIWLFLLWIQFGSPDNYIIGDRSQMTAPGSE